MIKNFHFITGVSCLTSERGAKEDKKRVFVSGSIVTLCTNVKRKIIAIFWRKKKKTNTAWIYTFLVCATRKDLKNIGLNVFLSRDSHGNYAKSTRCVGYTISFIRYTNLAIYIPR